MKSILYILTRPQDEWSRQVVELTARPGSAEVQVAELREASGPADYEALLEQIFNADSVVVW